MNTPLTEDTRAALRRKRVATLEPYRLFFPVGVGLGLLGVSVWLLYVVWPGVAPSSNGHVGLMIQGFAFCFIAGFALTAVPRMMGSLPVGVPAQLVILAGIVTSAVGFWMDLLLVAELGSLWAIGALVTRLLFAASQRKVNPPPAAINAAIALLAAFAGASMRAAYMADLLGAEWGFAGRRLLSEGMVLVLALGMSAKLGPMMLQEKLRVRKWVHPVAGILIVATILVEQVAEIPAAGWVRAAIVLAVTLSDIPLTFFPSKSGSLGFGFWIAHRMIALGAFIAVAAPGPASDGLHVMFVGGFSILILAVATRTGRSRVKYRRAGRYLGHSVTAAIVFFAAALIARVSAPFTGPYMIQLAYASAFWMTGMLIWGAFFTRALLADPDENRAAQQAVLRN